MGKDKSVRNNQPMYTASHLSQISHTPRYDASGDGVLSVEEMSVVFSSLGVKKERRWAAVGVSPFFHVFDSSTHRRMTQRVFLNKLMQIRTGNLWCWDWTAFVYCSFVSWRASSWPSSPIALHWFRCWKVIVIGLGWRLIGGPERMEWFKSVSSWIIWWVRRLQWKSNKTARV